MKKTILLTIVFMMFQFFSLAQETITFTPENFETRILTYQPTPRNGMDDKKFSKGKYILESSIEQVKSDDLNFKYPDYWNFAMAFIQLKEPKAHIEIAFQKAIDDDAQAICEYVEAFGEKSVQSLRQHIPEIFNPFYASCGKNAQPTKAFNVKEYAASKNLDLQLVKVINSIDEADQQHRKASGTDWSKQSPLDKKNLHLIDSLFQIHKTYIGKSLVGEKFESTMWSVVQHSDIQSMEKYLPIIHKAVQKGELHTTPLKMLLDRIHCNKYNYQFFGSQMGNDCKAADEKIKKAIKEKYNLK